MYNGLLMLAHYQLNFYRTPYILGRTTFGNSLWHPFKTDCKAHYVDMVWVEPAIPELFPVPHFVSEKYQC